MLWDKGVREFVDAARMLRAAGCVARFVLVGAPDNGNREAVPARQLEAWSQGGVVEWWGHRRDMAAVLAAATVVVLPTYGEGLPKVLVEAAAVGRAVVATDVRGCREIVRPGVNGLLVPPRDSTALAQAIERLLNAKELRARLGEAGRRLAETEFAEPVVVKQTLAVYQDLLDGRYA
jgi:glycosyltransferase involved in cell wall biosynthesis